MDKKPPVEAPYLPAEYELSDISAIQAMCRGEATADQQLMALRWIIDCVCKTYDEPYRSASDRDTTYALGKQYVGRTIVKATKLSINALKARSQNNGDKS